MQSCNKDDEKKVSMHFHRSPPKLIYNMICIYFILKITGRKGEQKWKRPWFQIFYDILSILSCIVMHYHLLSYYYCCWWPLVTISRYLTSIFPWLPKFATTSADSAGPAGLWSHPVAVHRVAAGWHAIAGATTAGWWWLEPWNGWHDFPYWMFHGVFNGVFNGI